MGQPPTFMYTLFACRRRHTDTNRKLLRTKLLPLSPCIHNPSDLPLPSFHAYQHKTNRGGGLSNLHSNSYMFLYTPYSTTPCIFLPPIDLIHDARQRRHAFEDMYALLDHNPECSRETTHGWTYDNACSWPGLPGKKQAYGSAWLICLSAKLTMQARDHHRYRRHSNYCRHPMILSPYRYPMSA